jgi:hypothetical protein
MCNKQPVKTFPPREEKVKKNTPAYYQCLLNESLNGFNGQRITKACQNCKLNSTQLAQQRNNEIQLLMTTYEQMGNCLRNLLTPFHE